MLPLAYEVRVPLKSRTVQRPNSKDVDNKY